MQRFPHLAQRLFNRPLAIHPAKAEMIVAAIGDRLGVSQIWRNGEVITLGKDASIYFDGDDDGSANRDRYKPYEVISGVAIIEIDGTLVQKLGSLQPYSGMTGYDGIRQTFLQALADPEVRAICLDVDSPGGECAGCFDLADTIYAARGEKPIAAILTENAYSAAYGLASAVDPGKLWVPRLGGTGSIGIIAMHIDMSKAYGQAGLKVTLITYGDRKADGHSEFPLSDQALAAFQSEVDETGEIFIETVARNRNLAASAVREMQAATFMGQHGVAAGLADAVMAPDAAFRALLDQLG